MQQQHWWCGRRALSVSQTDMRQERPLAPSCVPAETLPSFVQFRLSVPVWGTSGLSVVERCSTRSQVHCVCLAHSRVNSVMIWTDSTRAVQSTVHRESLAVLHDTCFVFFVCGSSGQCKGRSLAVRARHLSRSSAWTQKIFGVDLPPPCTFVRKGREHLQTNFDAPVLLGWAHGIFLHSVC